MSERIILDPEILQALNQRFQCRAAAHHLSLTTIRRELNSLRSRGSDGWIGDAANQHFIEMEQYVLPGYERLIDSLNEAVRVMQYTQNEFEAADRAGGKFFQQLIDGQHSAATDVNTASGQSPTTNPINANQFDFTFEREISHGNNRSLRPHWPNSDRSGVTLGPGYDMGSRSSQAIIRDLHAIGVDEGMASQIANASSLTGNEAKQWVQDWIRVNGDDPIITRDQERQLFRNVLVPEYTERIDSQLRSRYNTDWNNLSETQQAMLFDVEYNPGLRAFPKFTRAVLDEDWNTVSQEHQRYLTQNGEKVEAGRNRLFEKKWGHLWR